ncbi:hypothetical protein E2C01_008183 [Portunus trituberculatus]|uniref:Uncharacterized protein n=1 Tax=Portunus trituberculatus TaxID=210409 RepID=A0A5B7D584_PORTR|nr:hypothetical protein [Portunus trituberculatus]
MEESSWLEFKKRREEVRRRYTEATIHNILTVQLIRGKVAESASLFSTFACLLEKHVREAGSLTEAVMPVA